MLASRAVKILWNKGRKVSLLQIDPKYSVLSIKLHFWLYQLIFVPLL